MPAVDLARRNGVQLAREGVWATSTGVWDAKLADFAAAIEARQCPAIRQPVLKIGHTDKRFTPGDGEPAIGYVDNLRVEGDALVGDWVGVPRWINEVAASAWPSRSVEGRYNHRCALGHTHRFVLDAVSLLGVTQPGVSTLQSLQDVADLFDVAAMGEPAEGETVIVAHIHDVQAAAGDVTDQTDAAEDAADGGVDDADEPGNTGAMVALIPAAADAARLALAGGEPADELHVTLSYLGEAADLDATARQAIIRSVTAWTAGAEAIDGAAFGVAMLNPPGFERDGEQFDPCVVLNIDGDGLDDLHHRITCALEDCCADGDADLPDQHDPWLSHLTLAYTADPAVFTAALAKCGPVSFDRLRLAFGDQTIDIPLVPDADDMAGLAVDTSQQGMGGIPMMAAAGKVAHPVSAEKLHAYWVSGPGRERWIHAAHRWTALYRHLAKFIHDPNELKRTVSQWFHDATGEWSGSKANRMHVAAAVATTAADASDTPADPSAAEPEKSNPTTEGGDDVSLSDISSRLGLDDAADEAGILAAIDELKTKAATPPDGPSAEQVAAAAAERDEMAERVRLLDEQVKTMSEHIATVNAEKAATVRASVLDDAQRLGKFTPAERDAWATRYDQAPTVVADVLASIAPGTAVPVVSAGVVGGDVEAAAGGDDDAAFAKWAAQMGVEVGS